MLGQPLHAQIALEHFATQLIDAAPAAAAGQALHPRVPARDAYGIRVTDFCFGYKRLGKSGDISKPQHCRAEVRLAGFGWLPVDPADVRKVVLEKNPV